MASSKSRPLPCGTPSMMSINTISANSLAAIQCAAVAPTLPEPTIETLLRMDSPFENRVVRNEILHHKGHDGVTKEQTRLDLRAPSCPWWSALALIRRPPAPPSPCSG